MDAILGFLPDANPTTPGVLTDCANLIPTEKGMRGAPSAATPSSTPALAAACIGAAVLVKLDDTRRLIAGTATKLYELSGGSWTDQTRTVGGNYTGGADTRWSFAQFGDSTLAADLTDVIQRSAGSGAFANIATAPKAKIIFTVGAFVMALNTIDGTYGTSPNRWWCCAANDETNWTPSVSTLATTGQLVSAPGQITAGGRLGEYAVAYKERAVFLGQYVGAPAVWDWVQIPGADIGCVGQDAWCDIGSAHFFVGADGFYMFDGSRPAPLGVGEVRQWWSENSNPSYRYKTQCVFDRQNALVWVFYCSTGSTTPDAAIVWHAASKRWGRVSQSVEAVLNYIGAGVTIDGLTSFSSSIDGLSSYSFDSQFWLSGGRSMAIVNTSHQLQSMTGASTSSSMTTGDAGDDDLYTLMTTIRLRFEPGFKPSAASVNTYVRDTLADALTASTAGASMYDGKFDVMDDGRWHRAAVTFTGDHRVMAIGADLVAEGNV